MLGLGETASCMWLGLSLAVWPQARHSHLCASVFPRRKISLGEHPACFEWVEMAWKKATASDVNASHLVLEEKTNYKNTYSSWGSCTRHCFTLLCTWNKTNLISIFYSEWYLQHGLEAALGHLGGLSSSPPCLPPPALRKRPETTRARLHEADGKTQRRGPLTTVWNILEATHRLSNHIITFTQFFLKFTLGIDFINFCTKIT